jgi:hypothetical protein
MLSCSKQGIFALIVLKNSGLDVSRTVYFRVILALFGGIWHFSRPFKAIFESGDGVRTDLGVKNAPSSAREVEFIPSLRRETKLPAKVWQVFGDLIQQVAANWSAGGLTSSGLRIGTCDLNRLTRPPSTASSFFPPECNVPICLRTIRRVGLRLFVACASTRFRTR